VKVAGRDLRRIFRRYGYRLAPLVEEDVPRKYANILSGELVLCNFCGTIFVEEGPRHSESMACPHCDSIARERVMYACLLHVVGSRSGQKKLIFNGAGELSALRLMECSPRQHLNRRFIYEKSLGSYLAADFDQSGHKGDIAMDLTRREDVEPYRAAFDAILCAHVLEHIPDFRVALRNLHTMLAEGGVLILQVPLLESEYTPVTWQEFHMDNTPVYHRFAFDLLFELENVFREVVPVVGLLDFEVNSPEVKMEKYRLLQEMPDRCLVLGEEMLRVHGLGPAELCDAFIVYKSSPFSPVSPVGDDTAINSTK
jgi:SAM-dependent methyltransferase